MPTECPKCPNPKGYFQLRDKKAAAFQPGIFLSGLPCTREVAMELQRTLGCTTFVEGLGLHTGKVVPMWIHPAPPDHGIVFVRCDLRSKVRIPATLDFVVDTTLATTLGKDGEVLSTVEHLLSALWGTGVDNALVEVGGPEIPILDGSAAPFVRMIKEAGISLQPKARKYFVIRRPFHVKDKDRTVSLYPCPEFIVSFSIDFDHPLIGTQFFQLRLSDGNYERLISKARTFGFLRDVEYMKAMGYALGGSLDNAVVLDDTGILNPGGLRYPDEFVRHKILDCLGDLSLLGARIKGHLVAHRSGHSLNHKLLLQLVQARDGWTVAQGSIGPRETGVESHSLQDPPLSRKARALLA